MKKGKHEKEKFKIIEMYSALIFIATLIMCIGYAEISGINLNVEGTIYAETQDGVFITDVEYISDSSADTDNSKINYYLGTIIDSKVTLGNNDESSITYQITVYNSTEKEYIFIGELSDNSIPNSYTNDNIEVILQGIEKNVTILLPKESISFLITFKYKEGVNITDNILESIINFRFKEKPVLVLSNEAEKYTLKNIYPDYTPQEYNFAVSNYTETLINNVPLKYYFKTTIDKPLTAKIYNENGEEVTENVAIEGDGQTSSIHNYTLKIIWDNNNQEEEINYNDAKYANTNFACCIEIKAVPDDTKYLEYQISKKFDIDIITDEFYFTAIANNSNENNINVEFNQNKIYPNLVIKNKDGDNCNKKDITYKISSDNNKFTLYASDLSDSSNVITHTFKGEESSEDIITLIPKENEIFEVEEKCNILIETITPYKKVLNYTITITRDLWINPQITSEMIPVKYENGEWVEADITKKGDWYDYAYQKWANVRTDNGYFVFIPRYAYKITSGYHEAKNTAGTMAIVFLDETNSPITNTDSEGNKVNATDILPAEYVSSGKNGSGINATTLYIVHPAFTAFDTSQKKIDGIWVAKYEMSMEVTTDGGNTWNHQATESETTGNISIGSSTTKRMVSKSGVSSWRNITVSNIFNNCYNMNRNLDSHMMKNTEWGAVSYLSMSKYGKGATNAIEANKSSTYITGCGSNGTASTGAASTTGTMYGIFDMSGGSYEYVAGYLDDACIGTYGSRYAVNESLILADTKYKDVYSLEVQGETDDAFTYNKLKVGDGLWEISDGTSTWFNNEFFYAGLSGGLHYPVFDRGGDFGSWSSKMGINYTGRNSGETHIGVSFRTVLCVK